MRFTEVVVQNSDILVAVAIIKKNTKIDQCQRGASVLFSPANNLCSVLIRASFLLYL